MRTLCDVCESAAAVFFCAADEAALCRDCDDKVHMCNKLASRHVRVGLANPIDVPRCDICENSPAFFYCEVDGISLCLQCDKIVHIGGKRTHPRYLLLRQRVEFPGDKAGSTGQSAMPLDSAENKTESSRGAGKQNTDDGTQNFTSSPTANADADADMPQPAEMNSGMIDLNMKPRQSRGRASNNKEG